MALLGKFVADFGSFLDAVDRANVKLVDFGKGASGVEAKLNSMTDNFSGRKLIQEASLMTIAIEKAGGTSSLTAKQLETVGAKAAEAAEKLQKLGYDVPPGLQKIADEATKAKGAMEGLGGNLNIEGLISNPIGAATKGMEAFGESIGPAGIAAVGLAAGVVAVGAALLELTRHAAEVGGKLNDIGEVTGIAVPALSRLSNASTVAGTEIQTLSNAVFMMQKNMAESPDKFQRGLERLNINFADFKALTPDQELLAIAGALKATEDPVERNAAGFELMGRQFRDLAPALYKVNEALAATADITPWTDEQAKKAEAFEMQLESIKVHAEALGISLGRSLIEPLSAIVGGFTSAASSAANLAGGFGGILTPIYALKEAVSFGSAALEVFGITATDTAKSVDLLALKQENLNKILDQAHTPDADVKRWKDTANGLGLTMAQVNQRVAEQTALVAGLDVETKKHIESAKKMAAEHERLAAQLAKSAEALDRWQANAVANALNADRMTINLKGLGQALPISDFDRATTAVAKWEHEAAIGADTAFELMKNLRGLSVELPKLQVQANGLDSFVKSLSGLSSEFAKLAQISGGSFGGALKDVGQMAGQLSLVSKAVDQFKSSQGDAAQGVEADYGQMAGAALSMGASAVGTFEGIRNGTVGAVAGIVGLAATGAKIGSIAGPVGAAIGGAIGAVGGFIAKLTSGVSEAEKQGRDLEKQFEATYGGFQGMIDKVGEAYTATGKTSQQAQADVQALFAAEKDGPDAVKAALGKINQAFVDMKAKIDADSSALGVLLTSGQSLGIALPKALQDSIQKLIDLGKITGTTADTFKALAGQTGVDFQKMSDVAGKYGIDLSALGPAFQSAKLHDAASTIINDFDLLSQGGADTDKVLAGMRKPINDLVNDSLKFGVAIPANMKPWVDQLEKTGQLTDENGNKLTDLSGLKFGDPIVTEFQKIVNKLQELIDKITSPAGVTAAINGIPTERTVHIGFQVDAAPDFGIGGSASQAAHGGLVTSYGVQRLAGGGKVLPFPGGPSGIDRVPIWAAAGEGVVNRQGMATIGPDGLAAINNGGGFGGGVSVDMSGVEDRLDGLAQAIADRDTLLPKQIRDAVQLSGRQRAA